VNCTDDDAGMTSGFHAGVLDNFVRYSLLFAALSFAAWNREARKAHAQNR